MICEACDDIGVVRFTESHRAAAYPDRGHGVGVAMVERVAACLCPAGLKRSHGPMVRIDRIFPMHDVERLYFPNGGLPRQTLVEINDQEMTRIGLNHKMRGWTFETYPDKQAPQLQPAKEWAMRTEGHRDLLFYGPPGTGKTGLAIAMLRMQHTAGRSVRFVAANEWLLQLQASFSKRSEGDTELDVLLPATFPYLLVLDDLNARRSDKQSGRISEYFADVLQVVINKRQGAEKPTILTTNLDTEELQDFLTPTLYDRLREGEFWEFTGASNRMPKPVLPFPSGGRSAKRSAKKKR